MLTHLRIRDLGVIGESSVDLTPGFSVLTGETGAGKTMIVTSLGLLLGGRADSSAVRIGATAAAVDGVFVLPATSPAIARAREAGAEIDDSPGASAPHPRDPHPSETTPNEPAPNEPAPNEPTPDKPDAELIVTRSVASSGRGRAHLGGRTVPVSVLAELADDLVAVHGQSDQVLLRSSSRQRELLDGFAGPPVGTALRTYTAFFDEHAQASAELAEIITEARARRQEAERLRLGLAEVERVNPQPGEDVELRLLTDRLEHAGELATATAAAHVAMAGADDDLDPRENVLGQLNQARQALDQVARLDPALGDLAGRVVEVSHLVLDIAADLASYSAGIEAEPARLAATHQRRADLTALVRAYGDDVDQVLVWAEQAGRRLAGLDGDDDRVAELTDRVAQLEADLARAGADLTAARRQAAAKLAEAVTAELAHLSMPGARLSVDVAERTAARHGRDDVTFLLAAHKGAEPRPLGKGASGGELSRVMLAVEVATMTGIHAGTLVFDEVDAGVGGRAAVQIGRRLARLARHTQVIVVTHLPQVAAFADQHLVVEKTHDGQVTRSGVRQVEGVARVREIARMMAGADDSTAAQEHAAELLEQAAAERAVH